MPEIYFIFFLVSEGQYLFFEQWQRPPEAEKVPVVSVPWPWHLFLKEDDSGGFPAETAATVAGGRGGSRSDDPFLPLETLPSPVIDDRKEEFADDIGVEMLKLLVSFEY